MLDGRWHFAHREKERGARVEKEKERIAKQGYSPDVSTRTAEMAVATAVATA